ncbi:hypothetical protein FBU30_004257 [Linnemannia zychae]|nr:hypothetical protein FBU30_004257 [Linnemannia zychae]
MSSVPTSRGRRSATVATVPSSSSIYPGGPPPPPPPGHPNQSVQAYSSQQIQLPHQLPPHHHAADSIQRSYTSSDLYSQSISPPQQQPSQSQPRSQQENRPDQNWRSIFDAALVKAQQAVQLDELGETTMAIQLYSQAANDLGRVIPMCGSEKKKQSMLTIQAIYLDRVQQLKTAAKANASKKTTTSAEEDYNQRTAAYQQQQDQFQQQQYQQQLQQEQQYQPLDHYVSQAPYQIPQSQYLTSQDTYQLQQQQQQQLYNHPLPPTPFTAPQTNEKEKEGGFKLFGKKKTKTQIDEYALPQQQQQSVQDGSYNYTSYNDYANNGGYISPPYSEPQKMSDSPATLGTPVFMTQPHTPSLTPPIASNSSAVEASLEQSTKSSRWRPFGKKKSKSFSTGENTSSSFQPQSDYELPAPSLPMGLQQPYQQHQHLVDPSDHADAYSQQQHADWLIANDNSRMPSEGYDDPMQYYDDEDEGVDPYYIADNRGRAQAYEGKDSGKQPTLGKISSNDDVAKDSKKKPALNSKASYSNEKSFAPTFGSTGGNGATNTEGSVVYYQGSDAAITDVQLFTAAYEDGAEYDSNQQNLFNGQCQQQSQRQHLDQYSQQGGHFDSTYHPHYSHDPNMQPPLSTEATEAKAEPEEKSLKSKWFGKKNKKKEPSGETYDDVAKIMDEALFGGGSSTRKKDKSKDKSKEKKNEDTTDVIARQAPIPIYTPEAWTNNQPPPRKASLDYDIRQLSSERIANLDVGSMAEGHHQQRYYTDEPQSQPQHLPHQLYINTSTVSPLDGGTDELFPPGPVLGQSSSTPKALTPVTYAPRTTYAPKTVYTPTKKPTLQPDELMSEPTQLPPSIDISVNTQQQQQQQQQLQTQEQPQQQLGADNNVHNQEDGSLLSPDSIKKSKTRPFNLFKSKKNGSKLSLEDGSPLSPTFGTNDDSKSTHSDKTRKSSIQSSERKAIEAAAASISAKYKKRESDEYVPYEYQEEVEGPLMERVPVREDRDIIGFVLPVEEIIDYTAEGTDETAALENWDSWVNQLESFEKVLADKGLKKDKGKKSKKSKKASKEDAADSALASPVAPSSPMGSFIGNRSSTFSNSMSEHRPMSISDESNRTSLYSTRSSAIFGAELMSVQQAKRRWWNPKRKEATSVYSVSEHEQEKYFLSLLQNDQDAPMSSLSLPSEPSSLQQKPDENHRVTTADVLAVMAAAEERENRERQEVALDTLLGIESANQSTTSSLPLSQENSITSPVTSTQGPSPAESSEIVVASIVPSVAKLSETVKVADVEAEADAVVDDDDIVAPMPLKPAKAKVKSTKPKLLPISTPLAQVLEIQNPEELWQYVQQAKTYATTRMNKGDKRSAAIALKRAQTIETRWQEIMLELASSEEDEDELLDDEDDDDDEEEEDEEERVEEPVVKTKAKIVSVTPLVVNTKTKPTKDDKELVKSPITPTSALTMRRIEEEEGEGEDADEERRRMHLRRVTGRSDSAPDMFSKYKVTNKTAGGSSKNTLAVSTEENAETDDHDDSDTDSLNKGKGKGDAKSLSSNRNSRLGADATMEQMLETTDVEHLRYYIQRMKTDTVAKARSGSKFAALEGMKNVKVLQQRLAELEGEGEEEKEEGLEGGEQTEEVAAA